MREYPSGATRDTDEGKIKYLGFFSREVMVRFGEYMHKHRTQADGQLRCPDNWKKGINRDDYIDSAFRHFMDWWAEHDGDGSRDGLEEALCALLFNVQGYLFEILKEK